MVPLSVDSFRPLGRGNFAGLAHVSPALESMSRTYFLWFKKVPVLDLAISMPRNYLDSQVFDGESLIQVLLKLSNT